MGAIFIVASSSFLIYLDTRAVELGETLSLTLLTPEGDKRT
jgi:hypothetical protein